MEPLKDATLNNQEHSRTMNTTKYFFLRPTDKTMMERFRVEEAKN